MQAKDKYEVTNCRTNIQYFRIMLDILDPLTKGTPCDPPK